MIPNYNFEKIMNAIKYEIAEGLIEYDKTTGNLKHVIVDDLNLPDDLFEGLEDIHNDQLKVQILSNTKHINKLNPLKVVCLYVTPISISYTYVSVYQLYTANIIDIIMGWYKFT